MVPHPAPNLRDIPRHTLLHPQRQRLDKESGDERAQGLHHALQGRSRSTEFNRLAAVVVGVLRHRRSVRLGSESLLQLHVEHFGVEGGVRSALLVLQNELD